MNNYIQKLNILSFFKFDKYLLITGDIKLHMTTCLQKVYRLQRKWKQNIKKGIRNERKKEMKWSKGKGYNINLSS